MVFVAAFHELDPTVLYGLLRLRVEVFVVEQRCAYPELDGRDTEPGTRHVWAADDDGTPLGYLRVLEEPGGAARIGRVCVADSARGSGLARTLMRHALGLVGARECVLDAQSYLVGFYAGFGFTPTGPEYTDEDGIPHVPMALGHPAGAAATEAR